MCVTAVHSCYGTLAPVIRYVVKPVLLGMFSKWTILPLIWGVLIRVLVRVDLCFHGQYRETVLCASNSSHIIHGKYSSHFVSAISVCESATHRHMSSNGHSPTIRPIIGIQGLTWDPTNPSFPC